MRCCVPGCKNDSRHSSKSQGITFHAFPTTPSLRESWLKALGKEDWHPKERSAVCSEHFLNDDLYVTKNGLRKVRAGAVPLITQEFSSNYDFGGLDVIEACRMCLAMERRLYSIRNYNLENAFERVTGLTLNDDDRLPQHLCVECAQRLNNADNFRRRSLKAHALMVEILQKQNTLSAETLKTIDRDALQLSSPLQSKYLNKYDLEIEHTDIDTKTDEPKTFVVEASQTFTNNQLQTFGNIQSETFGNNQLQTFGNNHETFGNNQPDQIETDPVFELEIDVKNIKNETLKNDDVFADDIIDDPNYTQDSDSDDNLPLISRKKKKKKVKKESKSTKKAQKNSEPKIDRRRKPFLNQDLNETLFTVTNLTFEEQLAEIQKRQDSDNYKHSVFKCTECFKGFLDQDAYNGHMTRHTNECGEHQCEICKTHFKHSHALRKHITAHHTQRFSCNQCPYVTTHRQTARLHERWHKGTRYKCPHCPEEFVKFTTYMGHVRIKHPSDFVCELCGYSFVSAKGIELHKKLKHRSENGTIPDDGPFCEQCNVRFATQEAHRKHLSVSARHTTKETREANKANKGRRGKETRDKSGKKEDDADDSAYPSQLRKAEGPIPCEQCGLQLEDSRAYHGHFRRMHPDKNRTNYPSMKSPCMCEQCGRIFQSYALLKDHTWTHTGERPFPCSECGKSFRMKQRLVAHRRVHAAVRAAYCCHVCGKHFSTHSNRQRHMFIHTGLKPFKCEMCGKGFKHASEKRAHVTYVHLKKPWPKRSRGKRRGQSPQPLPANMEVQPIWPACEKLTDINILDDKPVYYNLKI